MIRNWYVTNDRKNDVDIFFIDFDVILNVAIEKCEHFRDYDSNIDAEQNIDFDVAKRNKRNERNRRTNDCWFLRDFVCDFECKKLKTRTFDVSWLNIRVIYFSFFFNFVAKRQIQYRHDQWSKWFVDKC